MRSGWLFLSNTFEVATRNSFKRALILFEDSYSKLCAEAPLDADIMVMKNDFEVYYHEYRNLYAQKQSILGIYEGHTKQFQDMIAGLPTMLRKWEGKIRAEYEEDSFEERMIFPNKRNPFLEGSYESRISAIKTLIFTLDNFPTLSNAQSMIQTYYDQLSKARQQQQEKEGLSEKYSSLLEETRIEACEELYGILARLMYKFRRNRDRIQDFFDLTLLRAKQGTGDATIFKGSVKDESGIPLDNVNVSLPEIGYEGYTDEKGSFEFEVETGTFNINIEKNAYQTLTENDVYFEANKILERNYVLIKENSVKPPE